ncbi:organic solute transporter subunit alpha-like isoform X2 [Ptychodera flava]
MADNDSCGESIPYSHEVLESASTAQIVLLVITPILAFTTTVLFIESTYYIFKNISIKVRRNRMIWLVGVYPVYSVTSCVGLFIPRSAMLTNFTASIYLSITLYMFLMLVIEYYGSTEEMHRALDGKLINVNTLPVMCCCVCLPTINLGKHSSPWIKRLVLQNAILRPTILFIAVVLWVDGRYQPGKVGANEPFLWLSAISIISTITAMQGIGIIHTASREPLKNYKITFKFMTIQMTLIFGNIQFGVLNIISNLGAIPCQDPFDNTARVYNIYNTFVIFEFFFIGILSRILFRTRRMGNLQQGHGSGQTSKDLEAANELNKYEVKEKPYSMADSASEVDSNDNKGVANNGYNQSDSTKSHC